MGAQKQPWRAGTVRCRVIGPGAEHGIDPATMAIVESLVELERAR